MCVITISAHELPPHACKSLSSDRRRFDSNLPAADNHQIHRKRGEEILTLNPPRVETDQASAERSILGSCRICGITVVDLQAKGLPSYCRRHHYVMTRVLELADDRPRTNEDAQKLFRQAESEASRLYGDLERY